MAQLLTFIFIDLPVGIFYIIRGMIRYKRNGGKLLPFKSSDLELYGYIGL